MLKYFCKRLSYSTNKQCQPVILSFFIPNHAVLKFFSYLSRLFLGCCVISPQDGLHLPPWFIVYPMLTTNLPRRPTFFPFASIKRCFMLDCSLERFNVHQRNIFCKTWTGGDFSLASVRNADCYGIHQQRFFRLGTGCSVLGWQVQMPVHRHKGNTRNFASETRVLALKRINVVRWSYAFRIGRCRLQPFQKARRQQNGCACDILKTSTIFLPFSHSPQQADSED